MSREQKMTWLLVPVWVTAGASLPDEIRSKFLAVAHTGVGCLEWVGETFRGLIEKLPPDWPLVTLIAEASAVLIGVLLIASLVGAAVELGPRFGFWS